MKLNVKLQSSVNLNATLKDTFPNCVSIKHTRNKTYTPYNQFGQLFIDYRARLSGKIVSKRLLINKNFAMRRVDMTSYLMKY